MAHICIVGAPGSGKSVFSQKIIDDELRRLADGSVPPYERLFSTIPLEGHDTACQLVAATRDEAREKGIPYMYEVNCGVLFIDELHQYLPARGYDRLPQEAMNFWTRHRHRDLLIVSNTQHVCFVDKICRIITDSVYLTSLSRLPFIGWWKPSCVRPPDPCRLCDGMGEAYAHARRDAEGDRATKWGRLFGLGAVIRWNEYPPSILNDSESLDMAYLEEEGIKKRGGGFMLFDMEYARRSRRSVEDVRCLHDLSEVEARKRGRTPPRASGGGGGALPF